jgi:hypothetical protein
MVFAKAEKHQQVKDQLAKYHSSGRDPHALLSGGQGKGLLRLSDRAGCVVDSQALLK